MAASLGQLSVDERVELAAHDGVYYSHEFFPKTYRQTSPLFHYDMWENIETVGHRFSAFEVFRDGAKTTILRTFTSKRVAYGISNTILFVSAAQRHAERSVRWVKKQVEYNTYWAQTFGLRKGSKWTDAEIEIINTILGMNIYVLAAGMTGQLRGLNLDDYRPDTIVVDDPCDEENTRTEEARTKTSELFFGALQNSLAPESENPNAIMVLAQTSLHKDDLINGCHKDPTWKTIKYSTFTPEGESAWPERYSTEELKKQKAGFIGRGQLHIWLREKECRVVPAEGKAFNAEDIRFYDWDPTGMIVYVGIDPAREKHRRPDKAHKAAVVQIGINKEGVYVLDYWAQKGKNPEEIWGEYFRMAKVHYPRLTGVESIAYQQVLAWYFRQKMREVNTYFVIREVEDRRRKADRIRQALSGLLAEHRLFVRRSHTELIEAIDEYADEVDIDLLDALSIAITLSSPTLLQLNTESTDEDDYEILITQNEAGYADLPEVGYCP